MDASEPMVMRTRSGQSTKTMPSQVPMWSITSKAAEFRNGSSQPSIFGSRMRCAEDEMGRNSVRPCTMPMTRAWTMVSIGRVSVGLVDDRPDGAPQLPDEERREDQRDRGQQLHEDVERRTGGEIGRG